DFELHEARRVAGYRSALAVPMLREDELVGVFFLWRTQVREFTDKQIELVTSSADQAGIAIENARLPGQPQTPNAALPAAVAQPSAATERLRVVRGSPADVQLVLDLLARSAVQLCAGELCFVLSFVGEGRDFGVCNGLRGEGLAAFRADLPRAAGQGTAAG